MFTNPITAEQARLKIKQYITESKEKELNHAYMAINSAVNRLSSNTHMFVSNSEVVGYIESVLSKQGYFVESRYIPKQTEYLLSISWEDD